MHSPSPARRTASVPSTRVSAWRATLAGLSATLVGIGLSRFAYTPLIPALIAARWFAPAAVVYLGAANLAGYLAGALVARPLATRVPPGTILRGMMVLATAAFFASTAPISFAWFFVWRFASGLSGGALMALAAPTVLPHVPPARRGLAGGAIFTGVGLGVTASATVVPLLLRWGLVETWCGLGALALALTIVSWGGWPTEITSGGIAVRTSPYRVPGARLTLHALYAEYGLNAVGLVPHMVFLVDFIARGLGRGLHVGARYWLLYGIGTIVGPVVAGSVGDRIGFRPALRLALVVQVVVVALLAIDTSTPALVISSFVAGASTLGIVTITLGRVHDLLAHDGQAQKTAWAMATTAFAVMQAASAYAFSFLFARTHSYTPLFVLAAVALAAALAVDVVVGVIATPRAASASREPGA